MAGEPIIVHYEITSPSETALTLTDKGLKERWWITFELLNARGERVRSVGGSRPRPPVDVVFGYYSVGPGKPLKGRVTAGAGVTPLHSGRYTLVVHLRLLYRSAAPKTPEERLRYRQWSHEVKIALRVIRADRTRLQSLAQSLAEQALQRGGGIRETRAALIALFSMPASVARPVWEALLNDPGLSRDSGSDILVQLSRLDSRPAVELLAQVWTSPRWPEQAEKARYWLLEMHRDGSPGLRPVIQGLLIRREGAFHPLPQIKVYDIDF